MRNGGGTWGRIAAIAAVLALVGGSIVEVRQHVVELLERVTIIECATGIRRCGPRPSAELMRDLYGLPPPAADPDP